MHVSGKWQHGMLLLWLLRGCCCSELLLLCVLLMLLFKRAEMSFAVVEALIGEVARSARVLTGNYAPSLAAIHTLSPLPLLFPLFLHFSLLCALFG